MAAVSNLKAPNQAQVGIFVVAVLAVIGFFNAILVDKFGFAPYAYCAGRWVSRTLWLQELYGWVFFAAIAYACILMATKGWRNSVVPLLCVAAVIQLPVIADDVYRRGGTCPGDVPPPVASKPLQNQVANADPNAPVPVPAKPEPQAAPAKPKPAAKKQPDQPLDINNWYTEAEAKRILKADDRRMARLRAENQGSDNMYAPPGADLEKVRYRGFLLLREANGMSLPRP